MCSTCRLTVQWFSSCFHSQLTPLISGFSDVFLPWCWHRHTVSFHKQLCWSRSAHLTDFNGVWKRNWSMHWPASFTLQLRQWTIKLYGRCMRFMARLNINPRMCDLMAVAGNSRMIWGSLLDTWGSFYQMERCKMSYPYIPTHILLVV